ncbi:17436_t:CDS:2 [Funneliformis geosporum]|uniref:4024_t:CDS:1 n=1 Tax=Funneliformis geosporum TaxID=1117311 RepID=A0A9W4SIQ9_9GLOM|nr:17436_t:CDS:2 [Funneliformis geosporum]CAI2169965.1 4024_t:CDS:2 [Funneliformis geosporum]
MEAPSPRITSALLTKYRGQIVRCVGRVLQTSNIVATLEACDQGQVTVHLGPDTTTLKPLKYVEVVGRVSDDLTIKEHMTYQLSDNFDLELYKSAVEKAQKYPDIFS